MKWPNLELNPSCTACTMLSGPVLLSCADKIFKVCGRISVISPSTKNRKYTNLIIKFLKFVKEYMKGNVNRAEREIKFHDFLIKMRGAQ
jgi:hypothetical protein